MIMESNNKFPPKKIRTIKGFNKVQSELSRLKCAKEISSTPLHQQHSLNC